MKCTKRRSCRTSRFLRFAAFALITLGFNIEAIQVHVGDDSKSIDWAGTIDFRPAPAIKDGVSWKREKFVVTNIDPTPLQYTIVKTSGDSNFSFSRLGEKEPASRLTDEIGPFMMEPSLESRTDVFILKTMTLDSGTSVIPTTRNSSTVYFILKGGETLHIRIFNSSGEMVVDKEEKDLDLRFLKGVYDHFKRELLRRYSFPKGWLSGKKYFDTSFYDIARRLSGYSPTDDSHVWEVEFFNPAGTLGQKSAEYKVRFQAEDETRITKNSITFRGDVTSDYLDIFSYATNHRMTPSFGTGAIHGDMNPTRAKGTHFGDYLIGKSTPIAGIGQAGREIFRTEIISNPDGAFEISGSSHSPTISFEPNRAGPHDAVLRVQSQDHGHTIQSGRELTTYEFAIRAIGVGPEPRMEVIVPSLSERFGDFRVIRGSGYEQYFVKNHGYSDLIVTSVGTLPGVPSFTDFEVDQTTRGRLPIVIAPLREMKFNVKFDPSGPGLRHGFLQILSNDPKTPIFRHGLRGGGIADVDIRFDIAEPWPGREVSATKGINVDPLRIYDLVHTEESNARITTTFTIENTSRSKTLRLTGSPLVDIPTIGSSFSVTRDPDSSVLVPGETTTFDLTFVPFLSHQSRVRIPMTFDNVAMSFDFSVRAEFPAPPWRLTYNGVEVPSGESPAEETGTIWPKADSSSRIYQIENLHTGPILLSSINLNHSPFKIGDSRELNVYPKVEIPPGGTFPFEVFYENNNQFAQYYLSITINNGASRGSYQLLPGHRAIAEVSIDGLIVDHLKPIDLGVVDPGLVTPGKKLRFQGKITNKGNLNLEVSKPHEKHPYRGFRDPLLPKRFWFAAPLDGFSVAPGASEPFEIILDLDNPDREFLVQGGFITNAANGQRVYGENSVFLDLHGEILRPEYELKAGRASDTRLYQAVDPTESFAGGRPSEAFFGTTKTSGKISKVFTIQNTGPTDLPRPKVRIMSLGEDWSAENKWGRRYESPIEQRAPSDFLITRPVIDAPIRPGGRSSFEVTFKPTNVGIRQAVIEIEGSTLVTRRFAIAGEAYRTADLRITGNGVSVDGEPTRESLTDFGTVRHLGIPHTGTFTIENHGESTAAIRLVSVRNTSLEQQSFHISKQPSSKRIPTAANVQLTALAPLDGRTIASATPASVANALRFITTGNAHHGQSFTVEGSQDGRLDSFVPIAQDSLETTIRGDGVGIVLFPNETPYSYYRISLTGNATQALVGGLFGFRDLDSLFTSESFDITFSPTQHGLHQGNVTIVYDYYTSDEASGRRTATKHFLVQGFVPEPEIDVLSVTNISIPHRFSASTTSNGTDFGLNRVTESKNIGTRHYFKIRNRGPGWLSIDGTDGGEAQPFNGLSQTTIPSITITGPDRADFQVEVAQQASYFKDRQILAPDEETLFSILFSPHDNGLRWATVRIPNSDPDEDDYWFRIQGMGMGLMGPEPEIAVLGNGLSISGSNDTQTTDVNGTHFGSVFLEGGKQTQTFIVENLGSADLDLSSIRITGPSLNEFEILRGPSTPVASNGGTTEFTVEFDPGSEGVHQAQVEINSNDTDEPVFLFSVRGKGVVPVPEILVSGNGFVISNGSSVPSEDNATDFGSVVAIDEQRARSFSISNPGSLPLEFGRVAVEISGEHAADFESLIPTGPIVPIGFVDLQIIFNPSALGMRSAWVTVYSNSPTVPEYRFRIQGTGAPAPAPEINIQGLGVSILSGDQTPSTDDGTDLGAWVVGEAAKVQLLTIINEGDSELKLSEIVIEGSNTYDFGYDDLPPVVPSRSTHSFQIYFQPIAAGIRTATLSVLNNDSDEAIYSFKIQGLGVLEPAIVIDGAVNRGDDSVAVDFGSIEVDGAISYNNFTINNFGHASLQLTGVPKVEIKGPHAEDYFVHAEPMGTVVGIGASMPFEIGFDPRANGLRTATVSIKSNDPNEGDFTFAVKGIGLGSDIEVHGNGETIGNGDTTPSEANHTYFGSTVSTRIFTILNHGSQELRLGIAQTAVSVRLSNGGESPDFTISTPPAAEVIQPGSSTSFAVHFNPSREGARTAVVTVISNDADSGIYTFEVQGTGPGPEIAVFGNGRSIEDGDTEASIEDHTDFGVNFFSSFDHTPSESSTRVFTIRNQGTSNLVLDNVEIVGSIGNEFVLTNIPAIGTAIASGQTLALPITYVPTQFGRQTASLRIGSNDSDESNYEFTLQGSGSSNPDIVVRSDSSRSVVILDGATETSTDDHTDFGIAIVGEAGVTRDFFITNNDNWVDLELTGTPLVQIDGATLDEFAVTKKPAQSVLNPGTHAGFAITFKPDREGLRTATVRIRSNDPDEASFTFAIQGEGVSIPQLSSVETGGRADANANLASSATAFAKDVIANGSVVSHQTRFLNDSKYGNQNSWIGDSSDSFAGINLGATPISIASLAFGRDNGGEPTEYTGRTLGAYILQYTTIPNPNAGTQSSDWIPFGSVIHDALTSLEPHLRHRYDFAPVTATGVRILAPEGAAIDELELYADPFLGAPGPRIAVDNLNGELDGLAADPSIDFGSISLNANASETFIIANLGNEILSITGITLSGSGSSQYDLDTTGLSFPLVVTPVNLVSFVAKFTPTSEGNHSATIQIASNSLDGSQYEIDLDGEGVQVLPPPVPDPVPFERVAEGGSAMSGNLATVGTAFAKDVIVGGTLEFHQTANLNDGIYGNSNSWIGSSADSFAGISLGATPRTIASLAFGRDNGGEDEVFTDRSKGIYKIQYTTTPNPNETTPEDKWILIDEIKYDDMKPAQPHLRHVYNFDPVQATGLRILTPDGAAIDELEFYESFFDDVPSIRVVEEGGEIAEGNLAADATAFSKDVIVNGTLEIHQTANLNDGIYGNSNSWIGSSSDSFVGLSFDAGSTPIASIALGRDNGGEAELFTDRANGTFVIQYTQAASPSAATLESAWVTIGAWSTEETDRLNLNQPHLRHRINFNPVMATGIRVKTPDGAAIDELEAYSDPGPLLIVGTASSDVIQLQGTGTTLRVRLDGGGRSQRGQFSMNQLPSARISGAAGNDRFAANGNITVPTVIDGGDGDDFLEGDQDLVFVGGEGTDGFIFRGTPGDDEIFVDWYIIGDLDPTCALGPPFCEHDDGLRIFLNGEAAMQMIYTPQDNFETIVVYAGEGDDYVEITGEAAQHWNAEVHGEGGNDEIVGANLLFFRPRGNDRFYGGPGADILRGGLGNDLLDGGAGSDLLDAGSNDNIVILETEDVLAVDAGANLAPFILGFEEDAQIAISWGDGQITVADPFESENHRYAEAGDYILTLFSAGSPSVEIPMTVRPRPSLQIHPLDLSARVTDEGIEIRFNSPPELRPEYEGADSFITVDHIVEYSDGLLPDSTWIPLPGAPHNEGFTIDSGAIGIEKRFYRVVVQSHDHDHDHE